MASLDGRTFVMLSSTASAVDPDAPTRFAYHEAEGLVWGEYTGDTVSVGRFIGTRSGDTIDISFVHALVAGGAPVRGTSRSRIEPDRDRPGALRLVEDFSVDGVAHVSVCVEAPA